jgi:UDP-N-acetylglucosamine--N-acetylmuramyl-(pentapeptide) pyrophosphoryl-undecaprenol N-acetylglucosamine transferase
MTTVAFAGGGTGGHLFPAIAVADAVRALEPNCRTIFAGAERGVEARILPERGLPHQLFPLEPIHRRHWWRNARWPWLAVRLVREIDAWLDRERPGVVIGTGGYVSGPVVWRAARRGVPTAILELDVRPGIATRLLAARVRAIWVAADEARGGLPVAVQGRVEVTGAPIQPPDPARRTTALQQFGLDGSRPVVVVTGGSQGSLALNRAVAAWLAMPAARDWDLLWATGWATHADFAGFEAMPHVQVIPFIDPMADAWAVADLCVARAGMMTLAELAAWGIPSILVPLPTAAADHQRHNAEAAARAGAAVMLPQAELTSGTLAEAIRRLGDDPLQRAAMAAAARQRGRPEAARALAERVLALAAR